jgi:hypothetical protein
MNRNTVLQRKWMEIATFLAIVAGQFCLKASFPGFFHHTQPIGPFVQQVSIYLGISQRLSIQSFYSEALGFYLHIQIVEEGKL